MLPFPVRIPIDSGRMTNMNAQMLTIMMIDANMAAIEMVIDAIDIAGNRMIDDGMHAICKSTSSANDNREIGQTTTRYHQSIMMQLQ